MNEILKDTIELFANVATILAFTWAVYEFYIKRRFLVKAKATPSPLSSHSNFSFNFEVINFSEQSLGRIGYMGVWVKRWNSWGQFWQIDVQDAGYHEKIIFSQDISEFVKMAVEYCISNQTWFDRMFKPKLYLSFKTHLGDELKIHIDDFFQKELDARLSLLCKQTIQETNIFAETV